MSELKSIEMKSTRNCGVCARELVYATESVIRFCTLCGREERTLIYCPTGHFVCDACHSKKALEVLSQILYTSKSTDPISILEQIMSHPAVPMHGPEHHAMVPGAMVAAVHNTGFPLAEGAIEKALERGSKVPGGWCGFYGDCGAAVGAGIAVSVITGATPLTGKPRTLAMAATSQALSRMLDDQPRCCKKASRQAIESTMDFLNNHLGINLTKAQNLGCVYSLKNKECSRERCLYFEKISRDI